MRSLPVAIVGCALGLAATSASATNWGFTSLTVPGATYTTAAGVNDYGQVAGSYVVGGKQYGYFYNGSTYTSIAIAGATTTYAFSVNDAGTVVGSYVDSVGDYHGYVWSNGNVTAIINLGTSPTVLLEGINNSGQASGWYTSASGQNYGFLYNLSNGTYTSFQDAGQPTYGHGVSDSGKVAFTQVIGSNYYDGVWTAPSTITTVAAPGASSTPSLLQEAEDINTSGAIVGYYVDASGGNHGFLDVGGTYTAILYPGALNNDDTDAIGISNTGIITGGYVDSSGVGHAFTDLIPEPSGLAVFAGVAAFCRLRRRPV